MRKYSLSNVALDRLALLLYGEYGAGKTRFLRDVIETELAAGVANDQILYISLAGDEGYMPLKGLDIEAIEMDDPRDIEAVINMFVKEPVHLICVDGLDKLSDLSIIATIGSDRAPRTGSAKDNEWGQCHRDFFRSLAKLRKCSKFFIGTAPADNYTNPTTGEQKLFPDLPGSQAHKIIGSFDFVVGIEVKTSPMGKVSRKIRIKPSGGSGPLAFKLRQRLVNELREDFEFPEGGGAWGPLKDAIQAQMQ